MRKNLKKEKNQFSALKTTKIKKPLLNKSVLINWTSQKQSNKKTYKKTEWSSLAIVFPAEWKE